MTQQNLVNEINTAIIILQERRERCYQHLENINERHQWIGQTRVSPASSTAIAWSYLSDATLALTNHDLSMILDFS